MRWAQGAVLAGLAAAGSGQAGTRRSPAGQAAFASLSGACVGAYLMWEFFPGEPALQVWLYRLCEAPRCPDALCSQVLCWLGTSMEVQPELRGKLGQGVLHVASHACLLCTPSC